MLRFAGRIVVDFIYRNEVDRNNSYDSKSRRNDKFVNYNSKKSTVQLHDKFISYDSICVQKSKYNSYDSKFIDHFTFIEFFPAGYNNIILYITK